MNNALAFMLSFFSADLYPIKFIMLGFAAQVAIKLEMTAVFRKDFAVD